jgi:hypothetical protein
VGWSDSGWTELDESEWEVLDDSGVAGLGERRTGRTVLLVLVGAAALAAVGCVAAGQLPRHDPLLPAFSFNLPRLDGNSDAADTPAAAPAAGGRVVPLGGPPSATDPSTYTLHGRTAATDGLHSTGKVVLRGRWNHGAWLVLARTRTDAAGNFEVTSKLHRRGVLDLRLSLPDGFVGVKTITVR